MTLAECQNAVAAAMDDLLTLSDTYKKLRAALNDPASDQDVGLSLAIGRVQFKIPWEANFGDRSTMLVTALNGVAARVGEVWRGIEQTAHEARLNCERAIAAPVEAEASAPAQAVLPGLGGPQ